MGLIDVHSKTVGFFFSVGFEVERRGRQLRPVLFINEDRFGQIGRGRGTTRPLKPYPGPLYDWDRMVHRLAIHQALTRPGYLPQPHQKRLFFPVIIHPVERRILPIGPRRLFAQGAGWQRGRST